MAIAVKDITWVRDTGKYANGEHGYIGKVPVGRFYWHASEEGNYTAGNIMGKTKVFDSSDQAKAWVHACLVALVNTLALQE